MLLLFIINLDPKLLLRKEFEFWQLFLSKIDAEQLILILLQIESKFSYCKKIYQFMDGVALDMGSWGEKGLF